MSDKFLTIEDVQRAALAADAISGLVSLRERLAGGHERAPVHLATRHGPLIEFQMDKEIFKQAIDAQIEHLKAYLLKSFGMRVSA